jgi:Carboxypeptidase activation peptide
MTNKWTFFLLTTLSEMVVSVVPEKSEVLDFLFKLESQGVISFWGPEWKSTEARFDFQISKRNFGSLSKYFENNGLKASIMIEDLQG